MELLAGFFASEFPVDLCLRSIDPAIPGAAVPAQRSEVWNSALPEALPSEQADFDFGLIQPNATLGRIVHGEPIPNFATHSRAIEVG